MPGVSTPTQRINLYRPPRRDPGARPGALHLAGLATAGLLAIAATLGWIGWQRHQIEGEAQAQQARIEQQRAHLAALQAQLGKEHDPQLARTRQRLEARWKRLQQDIARLQAVRTGQGGHAALLRALASRPLEALWLERIRIERGRRLHLQGLTLEPGAVPALLERLSAEPAFSGVRFGTARFERPEGRPRLLRFVLEARPLEPANRKEAK